MLSSVISTFSSVLSVTAVIPTIVIVLLVLYYLKSNSGLPPGPTGLPYFGYLFSLKEDSSHFQVDSFSKEYGGIFSFRVTGKLYIFLGNVKAMREAFVSKADCFNRTHDFSVLSYVFKDGIPFINGEIWKVQRKFFTQAFREYGMITLRDAMAEPVYDQVRATVDEFRASEGKPVDITHALTAKCCTVIRRMVFGDDGISQKELLELNEAYEIVLKGMTSTKMLLCGEIARYLVMPFYPDCQQALIYHKRMLEMLEKVVDNHEKNYDPNHIKDVIDCYIKERNDRQDKNDGTAKFFTKEALLAMLVQIVGDGVLSVALFIGGFLQSLVEHPECQERMYKEICDVVGTDRLPTMDDKSSLPYTNAFIYEVIRCSEFVPMFPSLECTTETTVQGYRIPKGSLMIVNCWSVHHDPLVYDDPDEFNPSRFITQPGKQRPELPVMFGIGRRACAGEPFTMMQVFLFLTATVQNFEVCSLERSSTKASIFYEPENMKLILKPRNQQ